MATTVSLLLFSLCFLHVYSTQSNDLTKLFYSQINDLLNRAVDDLIHPVEVKGWPKPLPQLGQVCGVAVDPWHRPVLFHRGPRVYDQVSIFNESNHYQYIAQGPIAVDTVLTLEPETGEIVASWASHIFYMPHGLTIDYDGDYYMTDIAMHQAFKFRHGSKTPSLVFGQAFEPGSDLNHLCQPTDVAVATTGDIFIADGYCNSRILKYDRDGSLVNVIPQNPEQYPFNIPHSLTLLEELDLICVADRENMRIVCPKAELHEAQSNQREALSIQQIGMGRVFAIAGLNGRIFAVNGKTQDVPTRGMTIDISAGKIMDAWGPAQAFLSPHDLEVCRNTSSLYVTEIGPNKVWKFQLTRIYGK